LNIAASAAAAGRKVLVVDGDFRRPGLAQQLGLADGVSGLGDVLGGAGDLSSVAIRTEAGFDLVGAGTESSRVVDRLGSPMMEELLSHAREQWDLVLFDAPPALAAGDAVTIASKADGAVLVVRAGHDDRGLLIRLANAVKQAGTDVFGVILNQARTESGGYFKKNFRIMRDYSEVA
jgi:capsular exopolysaccharide synthesis family protein